MNEMSKIDTVAAQPANGIDPAEWEVRVDLAACYRLVDLYGMTDLHLNHISARVPGTEEHFLINPFGMMYEEITASSLIKVDVEGTKPPRKIMEKMGGLNGFEFGPDDRIYGPLWFKGQIVKVDVEIWPTCIVVPVGYRLGLAVRGKDFAHPGPKVEIPGVMYSLTGVGPFLHTHPQDRPPEIFGGTNTLHFDAQRKPYVLLPVIPAR